MYTKDVLTSVYFDKSWWQRVWGQGEKKKGLHGSNANKYLEKALSISFFFLCK